MTRLLIIGALDAELGLAARIATARGARLAQADGVASGLAALRLEGADLVLCDLAHDVGWLVTSLAEERIVCPVVACGRATDAALARQAPVVVETWRRLTKALVYDHSLTPVLAERINLMRRAAYLRIEALQEVARHAQNDQPILDPNILNLRDSASTMRESLLSREQQRSQMRQMVL